MTTLRISGNANAPITQSEVKTRGPERPAELTESAELKLVVQDAALAEAWLDSKQWALQFRESDVLYQSPRSINAFDNSSTPRANVSRFTVAKHVNTLVPQMMSGIFYDSPPFVIRPRPGTTQQTTRAKSALFSALLDEMDFKQECESGMESQVLNGTGIWKWGWTREKKIVKKYVRKNAPPKANMPFGGEAEIPTVESDEFEVEEKEVEVNRPFFEYREIGQVLPAPGWRNRNQIWKAKFVIDRQYLTFNDLNKLRGMEGWDIPPEDELKAMFFPPAEIATTPGAVEQQQQANQAVHHAEGRDREETKDPLEQPLKCDERWDKDRVIAVLQDKLVIRSEEHKLGKIPFLSANYWNIQNAGYGMGVGRLIGADQRVDQGATNAALDILSFAVNQTFVRSRGANAPTQQIKQRLGGIIDVDGDPEKAFKILDAPKVPPETWAVIQNAKSSSESVTGADEAFVQGSLPQKGASSVGRSGTGAAGLIAASAGRIQGPVGRFVDNVFIPFLIELDEMVRERMPIADIRQIIGDELGDEFKLDMGDFMNARLKIEVLAGAHLAAKKAMAQSLPFIIQIFENPHMLDSLNAMGWTVDLKELFDMLMEMSEWKNSRQVVRPMNPQELQMYQASKNQMPQKIQGDLTKINAQHQADSALVDQKSEARLAEKLLVDANSRAVGFEERKVVEHAMDPAAMGEGQQFSTGA